MKSTVAIPAWFVSIGAHAIVICGVAAASWILSDHSGASDADSREVSSVQLGPTAPWFPQRSPALTPPPVEAEEVPREELFRKNSEPLRLLEPEATLVPRTSEPPVDRPMKSGAKIPLVDNGTGESSFEAARITKNLPPKYPRVARKRGYEGRVVLSVSISSSGRVLSLKIDSSSGHDSLDEAAIDAVGKWSFTPARKGLHPVASTLLVPVRFQLTN